MTSCIWALNAHGNGRSTWSDCSGKNGEAMHEQARSAERPSEPQANGLTALLGATTIMYNFLYSSIGATSYGRYHLHESSGELGTNH